MKNFPVTVIDNFFEFPDGVREFALKQEFQKSDDGRWPGSRTKCISQISPELFNSFCKKIFGIFYNFNYTKLDWNVECTFQKVSPFINESNSLFNAGWIHSDVESIFSGIVYLNKNFPPETGTSIYKPILDENELEFSIEEKCAYYLGEKITDEEYLAAIQKNNNQFEESIRVSNVFNRLMVFEGGEYHGVPSFYSGTDEDRLTLVFFVHNLSTSTDLYPLLRSKISS